MNHRQHKSTHLQRLISALLPGGFWHIGWLSSHFFADTCLAGVFALKANDVRTMLKPAFNERGYRIG